MKQEPLIEDLGKLYKAIGTAITEAQRTTPRFYGVNMLTRQTPSWRNSDKDSRAAALAAAESALADNTTLQLLRNDPDFKRLLDSLNRKAKADPDSEFASPFAGLMITQCVCMGKIEHAALIGLGQQPKVMSKDDWDAAIEAAKTLKRLQDKNGLQLWRAINPETGTIPIGWPDQLLEKLYLSKKVARKPSTDEFASDRAAVRTFVDWLLMLFGDAPEPLVNKFAELIGYRPDTIGYHLPYWVDCYKQGVLV